MQETTYTARLSIGYNVDGVPMWTTAQVKEAISIYLGFDFSAFEMFGSWQGVEEKSLHVEIYGLASSEAMDLANKQIPQLCAYLKQECIAVSFVEENTHFIAATGNAQIAL